MSAERLKRLNQLHDERRRAQRDDIDYPTSATRGWTETFDIRLLNLSPMGFHARGKVTFERDQKLRILLPVVGEVEGQVAWALTGCCGGWFINPIEADLYAKVLATIEAAAA
ncbi:hypothetical protein LWE61_16900 [Sphingobium sufflavum]|uniref:hypothetical protein n=1 Tax=Sphingobium sufflavum TaxID=1129547 RepID=UPI001F2AE114|nr:hypothetical protein [Sphingobium sufflavum]MCE7798218.1 hypothetical protein [Sphingobium sufflavum]